MLHARKDYNFRIQDSDGKIPRDEPVFLLRAQDKLMLPTLQHYLMLLRSNKKHDRPLEIAVVQQVAQVLKWQLEKQIKNTDTTPEEVL